MNYWAKSKTEILSFRYNNSRLIKSKLNLRNEINKFILNIDFFFLLLNSFGATTNLYINNHYL